MTAPLTPRRSFLGAAALGVIGSGRATASAAELNHGSAAPTFTSPQINLYSRDVERAVAFYKGLGFSETFRTPRTGAPDHVELKSGTFTLGVASVAAAERQHGLTPHGEGRWIEVVLWTDDTHRAVNELEARGIRVLSPVHDFLGGRLRSAWVADPDGNPIQLVQRRE